MQNHDTNQVLTNLKITSYTKMSSASMVLIGIFLFVSGSISGVFALALFNGCKNKEPHHKRYKHWNGEYVYEVLMDDVINEERCQHMTIFRGCFGRHIVYTMPKSDFYGKVKNYQGIEVDRFTLIN